MLKVVGWLLLLVLTAVVADAQTYRCRSAEGRPAFTDDPEKFVRCKVVPEGDVSKKGVSIVPIAPPEVQPSASQGVAEGVPPGAILLVHPDTGAQAVCSNPASPEEAAALLKGATQPMAFGAFGALLALYDSGRISFVEYCASRYELANYVRSSTPFKPSRGATYEHATHRWSVTYPDFWRLEVDEQRFVKLSRGMAIVGIHSGWKVSGKSLDEFASFFLQGWGEHSKTKFEVISRRRLTLANNLPAVEVVHHIGEGVVLKSRKIITIVKGQAVVIDAETYLETWPMFEPDFNRIIESFRVQE